MRCSAVIDFLLVLLEAGRLWQRCSNYCYCCDFWEMVRLTSWRLLIFLRSRGGSVVPFWELNIYYIVIGKPVTTFS